MTTNSDSIKNLKVKKAVNGLIFSQSFFSSIILQQKIVEDNTMPTFSVDGTTLRYNSEFADTLSHCELQFVLLHEVLHLVLLHHCRLGNRDHKLFNMAADYAINPQLVAAGFKAPKGVLLDKKYSNLNAEDIYKILEKEESQKKKNKGDKQNKGNPQDSNQKGEPNSNSQGQPSPGNGGDKPSDTEPTSFGEFTPAQDTKIAEETIKIQVKQAANLAKAAGQLPGINLIDIIDKAHLPVYSWAETLARFLSEVCAKDYSFSKINRRHIGRGILLPCLDGQTTGKIVIAIDVSGSIQSDEISIMVNEVKSCLDCLLEDRGGVEIPVLYFDTKIQGVQIFDNSDVKPKICGGGGTDIGCVFKYIDDNPEYQDCAACIVMTDGYGPVGNLIPDYPVIFMLNMSNPSFSPGFGEVHKFNPV